MDIFVVIGNPAQDGDTFDPTAQMARATLQSTGAPKLMMWQIDDNPIQSVLAANIVETPAGSGTWIASFDVSGFATDSGTTYSLTVHAWENGGKGSTDIRSFQRA
jgi:hypothetical protein